jgi:hypothetical protein
MIALIKQVVLIGFAEYSGVDARPEFAKEFPESYEMKHVALNTLCVLQQGNEL